MMEEVGDRILRSGKAAGTLILTPEDYEWARARRFTVNVAVVRRMMAAGMQDTIEALRSVDAAG